MRKFYLALLIAIALVGCQQGVPENALEPLNNQDKPPMDVLERYLPQ